MREGSVATGFDLARDEVTTDRLERGRPAANADSVALAQRLEPLVVADRVPFVFGLVNDEIDT